MTSTIKTKERNLILFGVIMKNQVNGISMDLESISIIMMVGIRKLKSMKRRARKKMNIKKKNARIAKRISFYLSY